MGNELMTRETEYGKYDKEVITYNALQMIDIDPKMLVLVDRCCKNVSLRGTVEIDSRFTAFYFAIGYPNWAYWDLLIRTKHDYLVRSYWMFLLYLILTCPLAKICLLKELN